MLVALSVLCSGVPDGISLLDEWAAPPPTPPQFIQRSRSVGYIEVEVLDYKTE